MVKTSMLMNGKKLILASQYSGNDPNATWRTLSLIRNDRNSHNANQNHHNVNSNGNGSMIYKSQSSSIGSKNGHTSVINDKNNKCTTGEYEYGHQSNSLSNANTSCNVDHNRCNIMTSKSADMRQRQNAGFLQSDSNGNSRWGCDSIRQGFCSSLIESGNKAFSPSDYPDEGKKNKFGG